MNLAIPTQVNFSSLLIWLLIAVSGFVMVEPAPFDLIGVVLALGFFAMGMKVPRELALPVFFWAIYLLFNVISAVFSEHPMLSVKHIAVRCFLIIIWLFLTCKIYENPSRFAPIAFRGYATATVITSLIGILAYYRIMPNSEAFLIYGRVKSTFKDVNVFAPFLVPVIVYYFSQIESGRNKHTLVSIAIISVLSLAILLGFSRGAWVNVIMALCIYMAIRLYTIRSKSELTRLTVIASIGIVVGILAIGWLINSDAIRDLFQTRAQLVQSYDKGDRFVSQMVALDFIINNPLGIGPGQFRSDPYVDVLPHNVYLYIFSECGWAGGTAFVSFLFLTIWKGFKFCLLRTEMQLPALVIFSCVLSGQLQSLLIDSMHWRHFYVLYALMWGVMLYKQPEPAAYTSDLPPQ